MPKIAEKLTDRDIERLRPGKAALRLGVGEAPGLMLVVNPSGRRTFYQTFRDPDHKVIWFQLGDWTGDPDADVEWARCESRKVRQIVKEGGDPRAIREEAIRKRILEDARPRWEDLLDLYIEHSKEDHKPKTLSWAINLIEAHLDSTFRERHATDEVLYDPKVRRRRRRKDQPAQGAKHLAGRFVADLTSDDMIQLHRAIKNSGGVTADRCLAIVRLAFSHARRKGWRLDNPAASLGIKKSGTPRKEFLDGEQLQALGEALHRATQTSSVCWQGVAMVRLLLMTGLRLNEVLTLQWKEVDLKRGRVFKADHKTSKRTGDLEQPISSDALDLLRTIAERKDAKLSQWILPSESDSRKHFAAPQKAWHTIRKDAGLETYHLHDLRRTFASWGSLTGVDVGIVSKLLNHSNVNITQQVYAQASFETKRSAADAIASGIDAAMRKPKK